MSIMDTVGGVMSIMDTVLAVGGHVNKWILLVGSSIMHGYKLLVDNGYSL